MRSAIIQDYVSDRRKRSDFAIGLVDDKVFQVGGFHNGTTYDDADWFDLDTWAWTNASSATMGVQRRGLHGHAAFSATQVFVMGGYKSTTVYSSGEVYTVSTDSWGSYGQFPVENNPFSPFASARQRRRSGVCIYSPDDGEPYYFGGRPNATAAPTNRVYVGNGGADWVNDGSMGTNRENFAGVFWDGDFYLFGGRTTAAAGSYTATCEKYTPGGASSALTDMPEARFGLVAWVSEGYIFVGFGENGSGTTRKHWRYDPREDEWADAEWFLHDNNQGGGACSDGFEAFLLPGRIGAGTGDNSKELYAAYHTGFGNSDWGDTTRNDLAPY